MKTNFFSAIPAAFFSTKFYKEVAESWRGRSFGYLLILLSIVGFFVAFARTDNFWQEAKNFAQTVSAQMPVITFSQGVASTAGDGPYFIYAATTKNPLIVIDAKNKFKDFENSPAQVLLTDKQIFVKQNKNQITNYSYSQKWSGEFGPKQLDNFMVNYKSRMLTVVYIITYLFGVLLSYAYYIILGLIFSLFGMIFNAFLKRNLRYGSALSLAIISLTPIIILDAILMLSRVSFRYQFLLYFIIAMIYLFMAIKAAGVREAVRIED